MERDLVLEERRASALLQRLQTPGLRAQDASPPAPRPRSSQQVARWVGRRHVPPGESACGFQDFQFLGAGKCWIFQLDNFHEYISSSIASLFQSL